MNSTYKHLLIKVDDQTITKIERDITERHVKYLNHYDEECTIENYADVESIICLPEFADYMFLTVIFYGLLLQILNGALGNDYCAKLSDDYLDDKHMKFKNAEKYYVCRNARILAFNNVDPDKTIYGSYIKSIACGETLATKIIAKQNILLYPQFGVLPIIFSNNTMNQSLQQTKDLGLIRRHVRINLTNLPIELSREDTNMMSESMMQMLVTPFK